MCAFTQFAWAIFIITFLGLVHRSQDSVYIKSDWITNEGLMKDVRATSGIKKLEAYGKKINQTKSTSAYALAFVYITFWKRRIWADRPSSFNYPSFSCFQYATYPFSVPSQEAQRFSDRQATYV